MFFKKYKNKKTARMDRCSSVMAWVQDKPLPPSIFFYFHVNRVSASFSLILALTVYGILHHVGYE